jgi:hypothetical protein
VESKNLKSFMKKFHKSLRALAVAALAFGLQPSALFGQATTMVRPREYVLLNSMMFTNTQLLNTNAALPTQGIGYTNVGVFTNTLIPFSGAHAIGLQLQIVNTNKFAAASNCVVTVYPAYDTGGGNATGVGAAYGTNFSSTPLLTWTVSYETNVTASTNLPATLGYTVSAGGTATASGMPSNIWITLTQVTAP